MLDSSIPACYFPSTVVFVDDDNVFLASLAAQFEDVMHCQFFDSPKKALPYITAKQDKWGGSGLSAWIKRDAYQADRCAVHLNLQNAVNTVYRPDRFENITVAVIDYEMPGMNGIELCKRLKHYPMKKILLTGHSDPAIAISALNAGIIDHYVHKHGSDISVLLAKSIHELQYRYFRAISDPIMKLIVAHFPSALNEESFAAFFNALCEEYGIIEFYLSEITGSFLLLDRQGKPHSLHIKSEADLQAYCELAIQSKAPKSMITDLENRRKLPYFAPSGNAVGVWTPPICLLDAEPLPFAGDYYYALTHDQWLFNIDPDKVVSNQHYRNKQEMQVEVD